MKNFLLSIILLCASGLLAQNAPVDYEPGGQGANWTWTVFENSSNPSLEIIPNPDASGANTTPTVAKFTALQAGQPFAGVESAHGEDDLGSFVLDETNNLIKIMVWKSVISDVGIKLVASSGWSEGELKVSNTLVNQWEELTFDFSGFINPPDPELGMLDQIVIFPDFDDRTQDNIIYFDNITFNPQGDVTLSDLQVDGTTVSGFSPAILNYSVELPEGTTEVPVVTATANDPQATLEIIPAQSLPGTTEVIVTAGNGSVTQTYTIDFSVEGEVPLSDYCETLVYHLGDPGVTASAINLTIANTGTNTMIVMIESANSDPVDYLLVAGGSGALISEENTSVPGIISRTLTWAGTPPEDIELNVLWSKESFAGNWQLSPVDIIVPFDAVCEIIGPKPYLALDVQDNFEDDGFATIDDWQFQDGDDLEDLSIIVDPVNPDNHVADYNRSGDFLYTNARVLLDHRMDLTERHEFELRVYFPSSNNYGGPLTDTAAIKLQNSLLGANAYLTQTEVLMPVNAYDTWQTLVFDFSAVADSVNYDQIVVQLGGENHLEPGQFYFDDLVLLDGGPRIDFSAEPLTGAAPLDVQFTAEANFAATTWQWDFDNDGTIDATVENPVHTYTNAGTYTVKLFASNPFTGSDEEIKENYITVEPGAVEQYVNLTAGWSGISSYVVPEDASIETIFGPAADNIEIIVGDNGIYFPSQGINTIVNWNSQAGYIIKMLNDAEVLFSGMDNASSTISIPAGWSVVPVTVGCEVNVADLFAAYPQVMAVKDVAGGDVFWPEKGINTIQILKPGNAYYIMTTEAIEFTFPECPDGY